MADTALAKGVEVASLSSIQTETYMFELRTCQFIVDQEHGRGMNVTL